MRLLEKLAEPFRARTLRDAGRLRRFYEHFKEEVSRRSDRVYNGELNNTDFMIDLTKRHLELDFENDALSIEFSEILDAARLGQYQLSFIAGLLGTAADKLRRSGRLSDAIRLAERASSRNLRDLFVQRVLISCYGELEGDSDRLEHIDDWLKTRFCEVPFEHFETTPSSRVLACCGMWLPMFAGTLSGNTASIDAVLEGEPLRRIRSSILDGSFRHCSRLHCPRIASRRLPARDQLQIDSLEKRKFPKVVVFSHDQSCNLSCPSCRKELILIPKSEQKRFDALSRFLLPLMINAESVKLCGSGDPFASIHFRNLLKLYCREPSAHKNVILHTNGVLSDQRAWDGLKLHGFVREVWLSLDAATEQTYNYTRRGGDYQRAWRNVAYLSELRSKRAFDHFSLMFVVQGANFDEMVEFVKLAKRYSVDRVTFQRIFNWGTYSDSEFEQHDIFSPRHARHQEFLTVMSDPIFHDPVVNLSNLADYRCALHPIEGAASLN